MDNKQLTNWLKKYGPILVPSAFILLSLFLSISLYQEKRYLQMTPWIVTIILFSLVMFWSLWRPKYIAIKRENLKRKQNIKNPNFTTSIKGEEYSQVFTSKDHIQIMAIMDALESNNVNCIVLNQHSAALLHYIPDIEMTIVVPSKDYESSLEIIDDLIEIQ